MPSDPSAVLGAHWEWRGFGKATLPVRDAFESLPGLFSRQEVVDRYIWIPGSSVNVKLRTGVQDGLKFKRLLEKDGDLELWLEDPAELFDFPLRAPAWAKLATELDQAGLHPPGPPDRPSDLRTTLEHLREADDRIAIIEVHKSRHAVLWRGEGGSVLVEWATITRPERVDSVSLENWGGIAGAPTAIGGRDAIRRALRDLRLGTAGLRPMSYLVATGIWAGGGRVAG